AELLEAAPADLVLAGGAVHVRGLSDRKATFRELARAAVPGPPGMEPGLQAADFFEAPKMTYPYGTHAAMVEVDPGTGEVDILRYAIAYDIGKAVNPMIVDGQLVGALAQGIGGALFEELVYDDEGELLTSTFMDYLLPTAMEMPEVTAVKILEGAPTPLNPLGVKGAGEGGGEGRGGGRGARPARRRGRGAAPLPRAAARADRGGGGAGRLRAAPYVSQGDKRREAPPLLMGRAHFIGDLRLPGLLAVKFFRSEHAHARIVEIDTPAALKLPGVATVVTAADLPTTPAIQATM